MIRADTINGSKAPFIMVGAEVNLQASNHCVMHRTTERTSAQLERSDVLPVNVFFFSFSLFFFFFSPFFTKRSNQKKKKKKKKNRKKREPSSEPFRPIFPSPQSWQKPVRAFPCEVCVLRYLRMAGTKRFNLQKY